MGDVTSPDTKTPLTMNLLPKAASSGRYTSEHRYRSNIKQPLDSSRPNLNENSYQNSNQSKASFSAQRPNVLANKLQFPNNEY